MRKIKIIVIYMLITIGFIFNGELSILYLDDFQKSYYQSGFDFVNREAAIEEEEVIEDFLKAGKAHDVDFFFLDSRIISAYAKEITIFGTPNALKTLQAKGILEGKHKSLFMGETIVKYEDFSNIKTMEKFKDCYYIGDQSQQEAMRLFKANLVGKYGGGLPKLFSSDKATWLNLFSVWSIIFGLILLMTIYEIISLKKEIMVRITLGEDVRTVFGKNALGDIGILVSAFLSVPFLLSPLSNVYFKIQALALAFLVFMIVNTLINAAILRVNFKKDIAARRSGGGLLTANYILKTMTTMLTLIVLSSNFAILAQGYLMYKQGDFFSEHKNYSYYQLNYRVNNHLGKTISDDETMNQEFYKRFQKYSLQYNDLTANYHSPYPVILINSNSFEEISEVNSFNHNTLPFRIAGTLVFSIARAFLAINTDSTASRISPPQMRSAPSAIPKNPLSKNARIILIRKTTKVMRINCLFLAKSEYPSTFFSASSIALNRYSSLIIKLISAISSTSKKIDKIMTNFILREIIAQLYS